MKITSINNYITYQKSYYKRSNLKPLEYDTVSFTGKKPRNTLQKLESVPKECFPSDGLREYLFNEAKKPENKDKSIIDMHKEYYKGLEDCKTLDEAKAMYPEFITVVDLKNVDLSSLTKRSILVEINNGQYEGLTLENISLELLKRNIGRLIPVKDGVNEEYFGLKKSVLGGIFDRINLRCNKKYTDIITSERSKANIISRWNDDEAKEKLLSSMRTEEQLQMRSFYAKRYYSSEEARKKASEASKERWQDPKYRERMLASIQSEESRENMRQKTKANWQDPEYRERMLAIFNSEEAIEEKRERQKALWQDSEFRERMLAIMQSDEMREFQRERMTALWQEDEFKDKMLSSMRTDKNREESRERLNERWKNPEFREKMAMVHKARIEAWKRHPEFKEAYSDVSKDFPRLKEIIVKQEKGIALSEKERKYLSQYFQKCAELYPDLQKTLGETQKEILREWGYYASVSRNVGQSSSL